MEDADTSSEPPGRSPGPTTGLDVHVDAGAMDDEDAARLCDAVERALRHLGCDGSLRVRVVDDREMTAAHERWSGVGGTTDVLTFNLGVEGLTLDADLIVCLDEAERQAVDRGHAAWREVLLYVVHGVLHCLGHDDHDPDAAATMHAIEDDTLEAIGVGRTYAGAPSHGEQRA